MEPPGGSEVCPPDPLLPFACGEGLEARGDGRFPNKALIDVNFVVDLELLALVFFLLGNLWGW